MLYPFCEIDQTLTKEELIYPQTAKKLGRPMLQYWIFDMDGTLTIPKHNFAEIRARLALPAGGDILKEIDKFPPDKRQAALDELHRWEEEIAHRGEVAPDAHALLQALFERGAQLAVLTRNTKKLAHITLKKARIHDYFPAERVLGRSCAKPKPEPDGILKILKSWDVAPAQCMMVGDYIHDIEAGRRAGCTTTFIQRGYTLPDPALADYHCQDNV